MKHFLSALLTVILFTPAVSMAWIVDPGYLYNYRYYTPYLYQYRFVQPYYYVVPQTQVPTAPPSVPQNPGLTIPPLPKDPAPLGFKWTTLVDTECRCVRWVLLPNDTK